jgi:hypothetical protein
LTRGREHCPRIIAFGFAATIRAGYLIRVYLHEFVEFLTAF